MYSDAEKVALGLNPVSEPSNGTLYKQYIEGKGPIVIGRETVENQFAIVNLGDITYYDKSIYCSSPRRRDEISISKEDYEEYIAYRKLGSLEKLQKLSATAGGEAAVVMKQDDLTPLITSTINERISDILADPVLESLEDTKAKPVPEYPGLRAKYNVYKIDGNTLVNGCFVLRPDKDPAAVAALTAYAAATENTILAEDITAWVGRDLKVLRMPAEFGTVLMLPVDGKDQLTPYIIESPAYIARPLYVQNVDDKVLTFDEVSQVIRQGRAFVALKDSSL